jgi:predicted small lipoprotein YifL
MRPLIAISFLMISLTTLLSACGQTGPLYLPENAPVKATPESKQPLPEPVAAEPAATESSAGTGVN